MALWSQDQNEKFMNNDMEAVIIGGFGKCRG